MSLRSVWAVTATFLRELRRFSNLPKADLNALYNKTIDGWFLHKAPRLGASLAFYTILSAAPLLIVVIYVASLAFGEEAATGQLYGQIRNLVGHDGAVAIQTMIESADRPATGLLATVLGFVTLFFGATGVVAELRDAMNTIFEVPPDTSSTGLRGILDVLRERSFAFVLVLATGFLLLVLLVVNAWVAALGTYFSTLLPASEVLLQVLNYLLSFVVISGLFALMFKVLPDVLLRWRDVVVGAVLTSILFNVGKLLIGIYLGKTSVASTYGAAGSLVVLLIWVYYSSQIYFLGAEFTRAYAELFGSKPSRRVRRMWWNWQRRQEEKADEVKPA